MGMIGWFLEGFIFKWPCPFLGPLAAVHDAISTTTTEYRNPSDLLTLIGLLPASAGSIESV